MLFIPFRVETLTARSPWANLAITVGDYENPTALDYFPGREKN